MSRLAEHHIPFSSDPAYAYAVGRIRALEAKLLTKQDMARLLGADDIDAFFRVLGETDYGTAFTTVPDMEDFEVLLEEYFSRHLLLVDRLSRDGTVTDVLRKRYDYFNLKLVLKTNGEIPAGSSLFHPYGLTSPEDLLKAIEGEGTLDVPVYLRSLLDPAAIQRIKEMGPRDLDVFIDREMYRHFLDVLRSSNFPFLWGWIERDIDLSNIRMLLRLIWIQDKPELFKHSFLEGGSLGYTFFKSVLDEQKETAAQRFGSTRYAKVVEDGLTSLQEGTTFSRLEQLCDGFIITYLRRSTYTPFGIEPLMAFVLLKEFEVKAIRTAAVGKWNAIPAETIQERLPDAYV